MKRTLVIVVRIILAILSLPLLLFLLLWLYIWTRPNIRSHIEQIPTVKEIADIYDSGEVFEENYTLWLVMEDGTKIEVNDCRFQKGKWTFGRIHRIGDICLMRYEYDFETYKYDKVVFKLNSYCEFYDYDESIAIELREVYGKNSLDDFLLNYQEVKKILSKLPVVDKSVWSFFGLKEYGEKKPIDEYCDMVESEFRYGREGEVVGFFAVKAEDAPFGPSVSFDEEPNYVDVFQLYIDKYERENGL